MTDEAATAGAAVVKEQERRRVRIVWVVRGDDPLFGANYDESLVGSTGDFVATLYAVLKNRRCLLDIVSSTDVCIDASRLATCVWMNALMQLPGVYVRVSDKCSSDTWKPSSIVWAGDLHFSCLGSDDAAFWARGLSLELAGEEKIAIKSEKWELTFEYGKPAPQRQRLPYVACLDGLISLRAYAVAPAAAFLHFRHLFYPVRHILSCVCPDLYPKADGLMRMWQENVQGGNDEEDDDDGDDGSAVILACAEYIGGRRSIVAIVPASRGSQCVSAYFLDDLSGWMTRLARDCSANTIPINHDTHAKIEQALASVPRYADRSQFESDVASMASMQVNAIAGVFLSRKRVNNSGRTLTSILRSARLARDEELHRISVKWARDHLGNSSHSVAASASTSVFAGESIDAAANPSESTLWGPVAKHAKIAFSTGGVGNAMRPTESFAGKFFFPEEHHLKRQARALQLTKAISKKRSRRHVSRERPPVHKKLRRGTDAATQRRSVGAASSVGPPRKVVQNPAKLLSKFDKEKLKPIRGWDSLKPILTEEPSTTLLGSSKWSSLVTKYSSMPYEQARNVTASNAHGVVYNKDAHRTGASNAGTGKFLGDIDRSHSLFQDVAPTAQFSPFTEDAFRSGKSVVVAKNNRNKSKSFVAHARTVRVHDIPPKRNIGMPSKVLPLQSLELSASSSPSSVGGDAREKLEALVDKHLQKKLPRKMRDNDAAKCIKIRNKVIDTFIILHVGGVGVDAVLTMDAIDLNDKVEKACSYVVDSCTTFNERLEISDSDSE